MGRAIVEALRADGGTVVAIELDAAALGWAEHDPRVIAVAGDARSEDVAARAADLGESAGVLTGWVNNAAVFRDASVESASARELLELIELNFEATLVGSATAVRRFLAANTGGAIVNVSSHQAQRPVPGSLPYSTAKAAIEGLTRALAVEHGPQGIRVNAVALGSIRTERYEAFLERQDVDEAVQIEEEMRLLHPLGRVGLPKEVAAVVAYLLSDDAAFVNGATVPVDGGRSVRGRDPEERR